MIVEKVCLNCDAICDWTTFHETFKQTFGFPSFYGRNMDAWIDCMTSLDEPTDGMSTIHCKRGHVLRLELVHAGSLAKRCPEQYEALVSCCAFVNERRKGVGEEPVLALSFL